MGQYIRILLVALSAPLLTYALLLAERAQGWWFSIVRQRVGIQLPPVNN